MILCSLCLLFFMVVGVVSMFVEKSRSCDLEALYEAGGTVFGRLRNGTLVLVSGDLSTFDRPFSSTDVRQKAEELWCVKFATKAAGVNFSERGRWRANMLFAGSDKVLLECYDPLHVQKNFLALAQTAKVREFLRCHNELRAEKGNMLEIKELSLEEAC